MPAPVLTDDDKREIDRLLKELTDIKETIARAQQAGIDVSDLARQRDEVEGQLLRIKAAFFPTGRSTR